MNVPYVKAVLNPIIQGKQKNFTLVYYNVENLTGIPMNHIG
jgi:hypothetical protein